MTVSSRTVKLGEAVAPKNTWVAPVKPQPVMRIGALVKSWLGCVGVPIVGPWFGVSPLTRGTTGWTCGVYVGVPGLLAPARAFMTRRYGGLGSAPPMPPFADSGASAVVGRNFETETT